MNTTQRSPHTDMTILYPVGANLYINITNCCPCACTFCIRKNGDGAYGSSSLWLEHEPSIQEVFDAFQSWETLHGPLTQYNEIVFCGYGEPLERLELVVKLGKWLRKEKGVVVRINTNGLADLIHKRPTARDLQDAADIVSISLNAPDAASYLSVTRPAFGESAFGAMLEFAKSCKQYVPSVLFTVVDVVSIKEIDRCRELAEAMEIPLRVRAYDS